MKKILSVLLVVLLFVTAGLAAFAMATGTDEAVGFNLMWAYALVGLSVASAIICAVSGMISSPQGIKGSLLSMVLGIAVVVVSYMIASGHTIQIANIGDGGFFPAQDTIITEAAVLVTYVVFGATLVVAVVSEIWGAFK